MVELGSRSAWLLMLGLLALQPTSALIPRPARARMLMVVRVGALGSIRLNRGQLVKAATGSFALSLFSPLAAPVLTRAAGPDNPAGVAALRTVIVVRDTTKQLEDQLEAGDYPADVQGLVKGLLRNYKLRENLAKALAILPKDKQAQGNEALQGATENLYAILEYFPEPLDNMGNPVARRTLKPDTVIFTVKALQASRKALDSYIRLFPKDVVAAASEEA